MTNRTVITRGKSGQAKDVRAAAGSRYGTVLPAEGFYGTKPAAGGNKAAKLAAKPSLH